MNLPFGLIHTGRAAGNISAGWLPSADPADWLAEVARCRRQGKPVALYPVAAGGEYRTSIGVLLLPAQGVPDFGPRVQPLAELLPGVHAPLESRLSAGLLENERAFFFPYRFHFLHPVIGLTGFDEKDELPSQRLLVMPLPGDARWNLAAPVHGLPPALKSIDVAEPPPPERMLEDAVKDIGNQPGQSPDESGPLGKAGMIGKGIAGGVLVGAGLALDGLGKLLGRGKGVEDLPPGALRAWAEKNWKRLADRRNREIERLMKLLEENPDEGLRYALPLAGGGNDSRGTSSPGWQLGARNIRFGHGGGGPADNWNLEHEARLKLEKQYREAAKRETALGRHDRAAYIYGNLLGDWAMAAQALMEGGRYTDAVSIYLHKLHNKAAAAKCYEDAGMLTQSAALYAETKQFEKAGDLHQRLGNAAQAEELWRMAVEAERDILVKARILSGKLDDPAAALEILDAGWRSGSRCGQCLHMMFGIHRKADALDEAAVLLRGMFGAYVPLFPLVERLHLAHGLCTETWQEPVLSRILEDEAYTRIGAALSGSDRHQSALLEFLPKLDPADLLLSRDARRYSIKAAPPKVPRTGPPRGTLKPKAVHDLSKKGQWHSISRTPEGVSVAGYGTSMLCVAEVSGNGWNASELRTPEDPGRDEVRHLALKALGGQSRVFHFRKFSRLHHHAMGRARNAEEAAIGTLRGVLAIGPSGGEGDFAVLRHTETSSLALGIYSQEALLRTTIPIDLATGDLTDMEWRIAGRGGHFCIMAKGFLAWRHPSGQFLTMNMGHGVTSMDLCPLPAVREAVVSLGSEVILVGIPKPGNGLETVNLYGTATAGHVPVSCYLPDGSVVIAYPRGGLIYSQTDRVNHSAMLDIPAGSGAPIDVCTFGKDGFAVLTATGRVLVFEY